MRNLGAMAVFVDDILLSKLWEGASDRLLAAFTDSMDVFREMSAREAKSLGYRLPQGLPTRELVGSGPVVAARLDAMGVTASAAMDFVADMVSYMEASHDSYCGACRGDDDSSGSCTRGYSITTWVSDIEDAAAGTRTLSGAADQLMAQAIEEEHLLLRAVLSVVPEATVRVVLGAAKAWQDFEGTSWAGDRLRLEASQCTPLVVLTEGRSDVAILEPAFALLHPHLTDLVRFMDFGHRPAGGAGPLAATLRTFAAAGIANRVVGLFDNDTAGCDALRALRPDTLPANLRAVRYPDLELARGYPTIGPPTCDAPEGRRERADVNGAACSIELYLGIDVLKGVDGSLPPVQWRSFISGMDRYQGEIMGKTALQQAFQSKLRAASDSPSVMASQDWSGLQAIFTTVLTAFH
ncbi:hypothetical protein [Streptomyces sp. NPDC088261]|uniref:hypothetical protein n=1 Tax=Streptomyces sp. NPDC088261 TaxID=3365851 RepID=UPI0037F9538A